MAPIHRGRETWREKGTGNEKEERSKFYGKLATEIDQKERIVLRWQK
jgi:hypothetical protein